MGVGWGRGNGQGWGGGGVMGRGGRNLTVH